MTPGPHPLYLDPPALVIVAEQLVAKDDRDRHWSLVAATLGRITDEKIYAQEYAGGYAAPEAWAKEKLDLSGGEWRLSLKLWRLMQKARGAGVTPESWHALSKTKALLVDEAVSAGGDPKVWFGKAAAAASVEALEHELDRYLSRQPFTTLRYRVPVELVPVIKAAMKRVLPLVLEGEAPASADVNHERYWLALMNDPRYDFRLLEALAVHALQTLPEPVFEGQQELST